MLSFLFVKSLNCEPAPKSGFKNNDFMLKL